MDLGTILNRMEAKEESSRYKNVSDACADVRLVFNNAMVYNDPGSHVHTMAQELSSEFEKFWYPLSLKVAEEVDRFYFKSIVNPKYLIFYLNHELHK